MSAPICPECRAGKHGNCDHLALVDDDRFVPCQCSHGEAPAPEQMSEEARLTDAERNAIWTCDECGHSATRHNSRGCTAKANSGRFDEFADDCKVSMGEIIETNVEHLLAERLSEVDMAAHARGVLFAEKYLTGAMLDHLATRQNVGRLRKIGHGRKRHPDAVALFDALADLLESRFRSATPSGGSE